MNCFGDAKALGGVSVALLDRARYVGTLGLFLHWGVLGGSEVDCSCLFCFFFSKKVIGADAKPSQSFIVFCFGPVILFGLWFLRRSCLDSYRLPSMRASSSFVLGGEIVTELAAAFS